VRRRRNGTAQNERRERAEGEQSLQLINP
jgi:hypothetical protein